MVHVSHAIRNPRGSARGCCVKKSSTRAYYKKHTQNKQNIVLECLLVERGEEEKRKRGKPRICVFLQERTVQFPGDPRTHAEMVPFNNNRGVWVKCGGENISPLCLGLKITL
eukprot:GEMP01123961.1.p1 GENE.GEMP01123961.1~~GEMP01123961.1.p1  ORF type:complete len:112 (+),score=7.54 GEMP01123961.1:159-494(+)